MPSELAGRVGNPSDPVGLARAVVIGSRWVGAKVPAAVLEDQDSDMDPAGTVELVDGQPSWQQAALIVAVRSYRGPEAVFGFLGADVATAVRSYIPDAELVLFGQVQSWGIG